MSQKAERCNRCYLVTGDNNDDAEGLKFSSSANHSDLQTPFAGSQMTARFAWVRSLLIQWQLMLFIYQLVFQIWSSWNIFH